VNLAYPDNAVIASGRSSLRTAEQAIRELLHAVDSLRGSGFSVGGGEGIDEAFSLTEAVHELHRTNAALWRLEDAARRAGATDQEIGCTKREIDRFNLRRHKLTESIDNRVVSALPACNGAEIHTETAGMIVDRYSVLTLREFHVNERADAQSPQAVEAVLASVRQCRSDLRISFERVLRQCAEGTLGFRVYRAHKLYGQQAGGER
jgi:hypothetical protein